jgi:hypothetical protein
MYLQCYTAEEIGAVVGVSSSLLTRNTDKEKGDLSVEMEKIPNLPKVTFSEEDWKPLKRLVRWWD